MSHDKPMSEAELNMEVTMYSEAEGLERIKFHEMYSGKAALDFIMYYDGQGSYDFMQRYMCDDTDGRYYQVHFMVWRFQNILGIRDPLEENPILDKDEERKWVMDDLIRFAVWAISKEAWAMDRHFTDSMTELLKIPQLSVYHKDIRTVWKNYVELAHTLGYTIMQNGFLEANDRTEDIELGKNKDYYRTQIGRLFGFGREDNYWYGHCKVEQCLRKNTNYPNVDDFQEEEE